MTTPTIYWSLRVLCLLERTVSYAESSLAVRPAEGAERREAWGMHGVVNMHLARSGSLEAARVHAATPCFLAPLGNTAEAWIQTPPVLKLNLSTTKQGPFGPQASSSGWGSCMHAHTRSRPLLVDRAPGSLSMLPAFAPRMGMDPGFICPIGVLSLGGVPHSLASSPCMHDCVFGLRVVSVLTKV